MNDDKMTGDEGLQDPPIVEQECDCGVCKVDPTKMRLKKMANPKNVR